ncbi:MAG: hypothetical protein WC048_15180 [Rhizobium sp.]
MSKKQKRDNAYYEERLKNEFAAIYAELLAGRHRTITEAAIAAGLKKPRTRLHELKNAFGKARMSEQSAFLGWLAARGYSITPTSVAGTAASAITIDRRLLPAAKKRIEEIITKRDLKIGDVLTEMGFPKLNPSLGLALHRGNRLQPDVIAALEKWLIANNGV